MMRSAHRPKLTETEHERLLEQRNRIVAKVRGISYDLPQKIEPYADPQVALLNPEMYNCQMRIKISPGGKRMSPPPSARIQNVDPLENYNVWLEFRGSSGHTDLYRHPRSPQLGWRWMEDTVKFSRLKLYTHPQGDVLHDGVILRTSQLYCIDIHIAKVAANGHMPKESHRSFTFVGPWFRPFNVGDSPI
ncbi:T-box transcription factor T homolog [Galendromus occidentalis]|uniref:T-box transcription factor T homolog n=1 Tax=Galendromus occidentalis TaxID=34638 RepID=A0AAJ7L3N9_9ACAR|nr:T-box transcription factor T homolog [Galendromus occidentalis]